MKCAKRHKLLLGFIKIRDKHQFVISNAFYTLEDPNRIDVIKTCQDCGIKDAYTLDKDMVIELVQRFPNAFQEAIRSYLQTWMK